MVLVTKTQTTMPTVVVLVASAFGASAALASNGAVRAAGASRCGGVRTPLSYKEGNSFYFTEVTAAGVSCSTAVSVDKRIIARYCGHAEDCMPPLEHETVDGWRCHMAEVPSYEEGHRQTTRRSSAQKRASR